MKTGWKVLCKIYGIESDCYVSAGIHAACVEYKPNEWANQISGCGPLCVFDTKKHAYDFVCRNMSALRTSHAWIFHCEYKPSRSTHVWDRAGETRGAWHRMLSLMEDLPEGTRLANRVRILEGDVV